MPIRTDAICVLGVPIDLGAGRRGVDMGPSAMRIAGLDPRLRALGLAVEDCGDLDVAIQETHEPGDAKLRFKDPILATCRDLMEAVESAFRRGRFPMVLGGDHSVAIGSVAGTARHFGAKGEKIGVVWFDAHGDFNTPETTPSGNIHGMPLAVSVGLGDPDLVGLGGRSPKVEPERTVIVGARHLDENEKRVIRDHGVTVLTMRDIDERGMRSVMEDAIGVAGNGTAGIHFSFDLDVVDPQFAPGTGTTVAGGLSYREAHLAMEIMADHASVLALDLVEVNPVLDIQNRTADLAVELALSLVGKRII